MKLTIEADEVEAAVLAYVQKKFGPEAVARITRFTRAQGTGGVYADVVIEFAAAKKEDGEE